MTTKENGADGGVDLAALNLAAASEVPCDMVYVDPTGRDTEVVLQVLGSEAPSVRAAVNQLLNARRQHDAQVGSQLRFGAEAPYTPVENDIDFAVKSAACRVVGWSGIRQPFSPELARQLMTGNPLMRQQVMAKSESLGNFTKA